MMAINYLVVVAALTLVHMVVPSTQAAIEVTNEQLRDGLMSLVHSYTQLENKLDRHEQRERALGEIIKRGLQALQKGQKIFEPTRGTLARLDERINQIETLLLGQDEKIIDQQTKLNKVIETMEKLTTSKSSGDSEKLTELSNQVEDLSVKVKESRGVLDSLVTKQDKGVENSEATLSFLQTQLTGKLDANAEAIGNIQNSIQGGSSSADGSVGKLTKELQTIVSNLGSGRACESGSGQGGMSVDRHFLSALNNQTLDAIVELRREIDNSLLDIKKATSALEANGVGSSSCDPNALTDLKSQLSEFHKLEQMLATMGDNVLSVKRGMEFNVHAITLEVSDAIKDNSKQLSDTISKEFEAINETILSNHNGALANLTSKIETEISQVWRQIGIMYQEVSSSRNALDKLQELTESYVNGTSVTMDSMEGKVSQITGRMTEVDSNLNFLLGRLSLVTQEFNRIKTGLGSALDDIRNSFHTVERQIKDVGPGPHKIDSDENKEEEIPDIQLLPQRDQPAPASNV